MTADQSSLPPVIQVMLADGNLVAEHATKLAQAAGTVPFDLAALVAIELLKWCRKQPVTGELSVDQFRAYRAVGKAVDAWMSEFPVVDDAPAVHGAPAATESTVIIDEASPAT